MFFRRKDVLLSASFRKRDFCLVSMWISAFRWIQQIIGYKTKPLVAVFSICGGIRVCDQCGMEAVRCDDGPVQCIVVEGCLGLRFVGEGAGARRERCTEYGERMRCAM